MYVCVYVLYVLWMKRLKNCRMRLNILNKVSVFLTKGLDIHNCYTWTDKNEKNELQYIR
jgi:hypothetical protein